MNNCIRRIYGKAPVLLHKTQIVSIPRQKCAPVRARMRAKALLDARKGAFGCAFGCAFRKADGADFKADVETRLVLRGKT